MTPLEESYREYLQLLKLRGHPGTILLDLMHYPAQLYNRWYGVAKSGNDIRPSGFIGNAWGTILNRNKFGEEASDLCSAIAKLVGKMTTLKRPP